MIAKNLTKLLLLFALAAQQSLSAEVDSRSSPGLDKAEVLVGGGGSSRTIYSQKHLSPHRMMHFGKRPDQPSPPSLLQVLDLYQPNLGQREPLALPAAAGYPYILSAESPIVPLETVSAARQRQLIDVVEHLMSLSKQKERDDCEREASGQDQLPVVGSRTPLKLMKMIAVEDSADEQQQRQQQLQQQQQQQQQDQQQVAGEQIEPIEANGQQQPAEAISLVGRSTGRPRTSRSRLSSGDNLSRAHLASILFGHPMAEPPNSILDLRNFMKKAEPQKMTFMHFGRK